MSQEDVEIIRRLFKAVEERDFDGYLAAYDPETVIHDAESLPYGGVYHGITGAKQHFEGAAQTWNQFEPPAERKRDAVFLDAGDYVVVLWHLRGLAPSSGKKLDVPVVNVYKIHGAKIVESQTFYEDTSTILQFLSS